MTQKLLLVEITPEQLQEAILNGVKIQFEELKKEFQPKEPCEFLTRNEVKDLLKIDLSSVWSYTKKGKLKAYGIGNRVFYKRTEVEAAIKPLNQ